MKKILITGANGFIGSHLAEEALSKAYEVYAGVRRKSNLSHIQNKKINILYIDISNKESLKKTFEKTGKFDFVIHNAGITKTCKKELFDIVNFNFTKNLIEALTETNNIPNKYIQISSLAAYGPGDPVSLKPVKDQDEPKPISLYGESKLKTEKYIKSLKKFPYLIFRPTGVYGPREQDFYLMFQSIKNGLETYIGTKEQYISLIYVKDLTRLLLTALESEVVQKSYFASDTNIYTSKQFNTVIKKTLNKKTVQFVLPKSIVKNLAYLNEKISCKLFGKIPTLNTEKFKEISQKNWLCDSSDLIKDFNFAPEYDLQKGVMETYEWYKKNKML